MSDKDDQTQTFTEIRYAKNRQWHTVYLTLLLFAGIIAFFRTDLTIPPNVLPVVKIVTYHLIFAITGMSIFFQCQTAASLTEYRKGLKGISPGENKLKKTNNRIYTGFFLFLSIIGGIATTLVIYFK